MAVAIWVMPFGGVEEDVLAEPEGFAGAEALGNGAGGGLVVDIGLAAVAVPEAGEFAVSVLEEAGAVEGSAVAGGGGDAFGVEGLDEGFAGEAVEGLRRRSDRCRGAGSRG